MRRADEEPRYPDLTTRQRNIVRFVEDYFARIGYPPTLREIAAGVGLKSPSSVCYQVKRLKEKGQLSHDFGRPRTTMPRTTEPLTTEPLMTEPLTTEPRAPAVASASAVVSPAASAQGGTVTPLPVAGFGRRDRTLVPLLGRVVAGGTITEVDLAGQFDEYVSVPSDIARAPHDHFALEVVGDSMTGRAILDGDRVVVRYGSAARNGDVVVAQFQADTTSRVEDEVTIKTYRRFDGHVWLMPENPAYDPIPGDQARILGRVVHLCRTFR